MALLAVFREGLNPAYQAEMACRDTSVTLSQYISTIIRLDNLRRQHSFRAHEKLFPNQCNWDEPMSQRGNASGESSIDSATTVDNPATKSTNAQKKSHVTGGK